MKSDGSPCNHETTLPAFLHGGGDLQLSFEGHRFAVESHVCSECGVIRLAVKHPPLFQRYLQERTSGEPT
jgi:hypothetical protein